MGGAKTFAPTPTAKGFGTQNVVNYTLTLSGEVVLSLCKIFMKFYQTVYLLFTSEFTCFLFVSFNMLMRYHLTRPVHDKPQVVYVVIKEHKHMQIFELFISV